MWMMMAAAAISAQAGAATGTIGMALMTALGGQAAADAPLSPSGKWTVEYADNLCVLSHDFGAGDQLVTVGFRPWPMGSDTEIVLLARGGRTDPQHGKASISLYPSGTSVEGDYYRWRSPKDGRRIMTLTVAQDRLLGLDGAAEIVLTINKERPVRVAPKGLKAALAALKLCNDDLLEDWGLDPHESDRLTVAAKAIGGELIWITNDDYPPEAIRAGISGTVTIHWAVGVDGAVHDCGTAATSGSPLLDKAACDAITLRGKYHPALDKDGKPAVSHHIRRVKWVLPT